MIDKVYSEFLLSSGVTTDSRNVHENSIFIGLGGPNFNGSGYAAEALKKGARLAIVDDPVYYEDEAMVLVDNSLGFLQKLGKHHREQIDIPVIGLTGSNGKTTTKELINAVLSQKFECLATKGNLNNHIGVPLTLLELRDHHEMAIVEMGANHLGEIAALCEMAKPTHGLITNIGKAHTEGFGGMDGVIRGKSELYQYLRANGGRVFINSSQEILHNMAKRFADPILYPNKGDFYFCELISVEPFLSIRIESGAEINTKLIGRYNFENIAAAFCLGKFFEVDSKLAGQAVARFTPSDNRSQIITQGSTTWIMDAYNANPSSMIAALESLLSLEARKKAVILGDMLELGDQAEEDHRLLGKKLTALDLDAVFLCGELMQFAARECPVSHYFGSREELTTTLRDFDFSESTVLVKGSRGMRLEEAVQGIIGK